MTRPAKGPSRGWRYGLLAGNVTLAMALVAGGIRYQALVGRIENTEKAVADHEQRLRTIDAEKADKGSITQLWQQLARKADK